MKKLASALATIRSTVYDPAFYRLKATEPLKPGIMLTASLAAIGMLVFCVIGASALFSFGFQSLPDKLLAAFPEDLVITIIDGDLSINQPEPYYVRNSLDATTSVPNLVIFDTGDTLKGSAADNGTFVLVKKTYALASGGKSSNERVFSFSSLKGTTTIDKATTTAFVTSVRPYILPLVSLAAVGFVVMGTVFGAFFWTVFHLAYLLIPGFLVFLYGLLRGKRISFPASYKVALYASIPVLILDWVLGFVPGLHILPFIPTLLVLVIAFVNISREPVSAAAEPPQAS